MKILLTLDGSEFAERAIPLAQRLARAPGSEVHLFIVADPGLALPGQRLSGATGADPGRLAGIGAGRHRANGAKWLSTEEEPLAQVVEMPASIELMLEHYLETVARQFPHCVVKPVVRVGPYPAAQIAAYAEVHDIDLIVMATHGRSGLNRLLHGSVAGEVLRSGVAPVALVRPTEAD
jgi:nucleotide-binding universal stress UspA family protein